MITCQIVLRYLAGNRACDSGTIRVAANVGHLEDGIDHTTNTFTSNETSSDSVGTDLIGLLVLLVPEVRPKGAHDHSCAVCGECSLATYNACSC